MNNGMKMRMLAEREQQNIDNRYMTRNESPGMGGYGRMEMPGGRMGFDPQGAYSEYGRNYQQEMAYNNYDAEMYGGEMKMEYEMPESRRYKNGRFAPKNQMEMHYGGGQQRKMQMGFAGGKEDVMPFNQMTAEKWVRSMKNADGSRGARWSMEQAEKVMEQIGCDCDPWEFYAALSAMYSDYGEVLKKFGLGDNIYIFADMAMAFIEDEDAQPEKMARYYQYIVKH